MRGCQVLAKCQASAKRSGKVTGQIIRFMVTSNESCISIEEGLWPELCQRHIALSTWDKDSLENESALLQFQVLKNVEAAGSSTSYLHFSPLLFLPLPLLFTSYC